MPMERGDVATCEGVFKMHDVFAANPSDFEEVLSDAFFFGLVALGGQSHAMF